MVDLTLLLKVVSYKNAPPLAPIEYKFGTEGGSIGRGAQCSWILEDPEKFLSGQHATITYSPPDFVLTDTSSNGVYVNQTSAPLGRGNSVRLADGDSLEIGEYRISISVAQAADPTEDALFDVGFDDQLSRNDDPFSDFGDDQLEGEDKDLATDDDWFDSDTGDDPFADWHDSPPKTSQGSEPDNVSDLNSFFPSNNVEPEPTSPVSKSDSNNAHDLFDFSDEWSTDETPSDSSTAPQAPINVAPEAPSQPPPPQPQPQPQPQPNSTSKHSHAHSDISAHLEQFFAGAGLSLDSPSESVSPQMFFLIGQVLRTTVQGAMDVLIARSEIKNEMRLDVTTLRAVQNNPIKFSLNADEALTRLLSPQQKGYMPPARAVEEAFEDIRAHQIAVLAGMQTALHSILKRFDPEKLEERLHRSSPISASIPIHRQAKLWDLFEQLYEDIEHEAQDDFNQLFGRAFSKAYEEQIRKIKAARSNSPID